MVRIGGRYDWTHRAVHSYEHGRSVPEHTLLPEKYWRYELGVRTRHGERRGREPRTLRRID